MTNAVTSFRRMLKYAGRQKGQIVRGIPAQRQWGELQSAAVQLNWDHPLDFALMA